MNATTTASTTTTTGHRGLMGKILPVCLVLYVAVPIAIAHGQR